MGSMGDIERFRWDDFERAQEQWEYRREIEAGEDEGLSEDGRYKDPCRECRRRHCDECGF